MAEMIDEFIALGASIIREALPARYGADGRFVPEAPPAVGTPQPGFVGRRYRGVVILAPHPGEGGRASREPVHRVWDQVIAAWSANPSSETYDAVLRLWAEDREEWGPVWTRWTEPVLRGAGLAPDEVAFLNLIKNPLISNTSPLAQRRMAAVDWDWTKRQLDLLKPRAVVAGGKLVSEFLRSRVGNDFAVREQNRAIARAGVVGASRREIEAVETQELAAWVANIIRDEGRVRAI